jgi:hypothetical protein
VHDGAIDFQSSSSVNWHRDEISERIGLGDFELFQEVKTIEARISTPIIVKT